MSADADAAGAEDAAAGSGADRGAGPGADTGRGVAGRRWEVQPPEVAKLARVVFALLVVACGAAFIVTQRLKHTPTAVQDFKLTPFFSPTPKGHIKEARISFKLAQADRVTVTVIDSSEQAVATLVDEWPVVRYKQFSLRWNGRRGTARARTARVALGPLGTTIVTPVNTGSPAPAGEYHVEVRLREQKKTVISPNGFTLVRP